MTWRRWNSLTWQLFINWFWSLLTSCSHSFFFNFQIDRSGKIPMLRFRDRESYSGNKTKEYDDIAMKYLTYVLLFLVACSSIYSLKYEQHKSWYSWVLSSFTSCVYMFGKLLILLHAHCIHGTYWKTKPILHVAIFLFNVFVVLLPLIVDFLKGVYELFYMI